MQLFLVIIQLIFFACSCYAIEDFQIDLSTHEVIKTKNFKGTNITLKIDYKLLENEKFIVEVHGPKHQYRIWKKEKKFGIWTKSQNFITKKISSYQFVATNMSKRELINFVRSFFIDIFGTKISFVDQEKYSAAELNDSLNALFKSQEDSTYYSMLFDLVNIKLNRGVDILIPASAIVGEYKINVYVANGRKIVSKSTTLEVKRNEFYDDFRVWTKEMPKSYAMLCIVLTIFFGLIVNYLITKKRA